VPRDPHKLHLGKGVRFVKSHLRRLRQSRDVWETDFMPTRWGGRNVWQGLVINHDGCRALRERTVERPPNVNDMADLLSDAMLHPGDEEPRRPRTLRIRKRREWQELLPHLEKIGIRVVSAPRLAKWDRTSRTSAAPSCAPIPRQGSRLSKNSIPLSHSSSEAAAGSRSETNRAWAYMLGPWITAGWCSRT
jgi:hypothetical protein